MELMIVSGFIVFLPKYLETQFFLSNVQASIFTGKTLLEYFCYLHIYLHILNLIFSSFSVIDIVLA